jgi:hypothetical protein
MLIDNINALKTHFPLAWKKMKNEQERNLHEVRLEQARTGDWTASILTDTGWTYLHSKYNPIQEAERFISSLVDIENRHIFFYGVGLGYHIDLLMNKYPNMTFTIYEPNPVIFQKCMELFPLEKWSPSKRLKDVMVETTPGDLVEFLKQFTHYLDKEVSIVIWPSYERIFAEKTKAFVEKFREVVYEKRDYLMTGMLFVKRMAINGFRNLPVILNTPNLLHGHGGMFNNKPAIIVSAGPSLNDEYDNLRYIKKNGLAYIFSVGSAVNSLISEGIHPDAAFTYDGTVMNEKVFQKIKNENITDIPLVFGSTVGYETIQNYPGQMANFLVIRDYIIDLFLRRSDNQPFKYIERYSSIATITLQILHELGCSPIILVGQNFAYRGDQSYARGIEYIDPQLGEKRRENALVVKDVYGNETLSSRGHIKMRKEMEELIQTFQHAEIINTTKGGAHIDGTTFIPLEQVISDKLRERQVVESEWSHSLKTEYEYDLHHFRKMAHRMLASHDELHRIIQRFSQLFEEMEGYLSSRNLPQLEICFTKFDRWFDRLQQNAFNIEIIQKMNYLEFNMILKMFEEVRFHHDVTEKAKRVINEFGNYLNNCRRDMVIVKTLLQEMYEEVLGEPILA